MLWEYQIAGFSPFWSIYPNQQPQRIRKASSVEQAVAQQLNLPLDWLFPKAYAGPTDLNVEDQGSYYTLGGMRVKLLFQAEKNTLLGAPLDIIWEAKVNIPEANASGNFYKEEDPAAQAYPNRLPNGAVLSPSAYLYQVYFEPATWKTGQDIEITARVKYESLPGYKNYKFNLKTRELYPVTASKPNIYDTENPQAPIQGADVAMLESLLWQLGLSPQYQLVKTGGKSGALGARIDSSRSGAGPSNTKNCQNTAADDRSKFYSGWKGQCAVGLVSLEGMVRRFQGRTFEPSNLAGHNTTSQVHGKVDNATLKALEKVYSHYRIATHSYPSDQRFTASNIPDGETGSWWKELSKLLNEGGNIPYVDAGASYRLEKTYTEAIHTALIANFPTNAKTITREGILKSWNYQENGGHFWGTGDYQRTPFRIYEGYSDEEGSFGFNHIVWKRMYSQTPAADDCSSFRGYLAENHNVNLFHPKNSLMAFVAASADGCGSSRGLYWSYVKPDETDGYASDIPEAERPKAYCYLDKDKATYCDREVVNKDHWKTYSATKVSGQELLGKAIIAYNRGANGFGERHYFSTTQMLKSDPNKKQPNRTFDYWMKIKGKTQTRAGITGYIPYVTYLWKGGLGFDANGSGGALENIPNDPLTLDVDETYNENLISWCFLYGEKDWIGPIKDLLTKKYLDFEGYKKLAVAQKARRISCE